MSGREIFRRQMAVVGVRRDRSTGPYEVELVNLLGLSGEASMDMTIYLDSAPTIGQVIDVVLTVPEAEPSPRGFIQPCGSPEAPSR